MHPRTEHSTSLLDIRGFLAAERAAPAPWAAPEQSVESLHALLVARRDDPRFWTRLEDLLRRLEDPGVDVARLAHSEALGRAEVARLLADLRADLRPLDGADPIAWKRALAGSLRATSLAALLLLGTAAACQGAPCYEASAVGLKAGDEADVYCDLVDIIRSSALPSETKADLLDCLPRLDAGYREEILDDFESMGDLELLYALEGLLSCGGECTFNDFDCH